MLEAGSHTLSGPSDFHIRTGGGEEAAPRRGIVRFILESLARTATDQERGESQRTPRLGFFTRYTYPVVVEHTDRREAVHGSAHGLSGLTALLITCLSCAGTDSTVPERTSYKSQFIADVPTDYVPRSLSLSPDRRSVALVRTSGDGLQVETRGRIRTAYGPYKHACELVWTRKDGLFFHVTTNDGKEAIVKNGVAGPAFDRIGHSFKIDEQSGQAAYLAHAGNDLFLVINDQRIPINGNCRSFTVSGGTCAFVRETKEGQCVVFNGQAGRLFAHVSQPRLSSGIVTYSAIEKLEADRIRYWTISDGKESEVPMFLERPITSPVGNRVAWLAVDIMGDLGMQLICDGSIIAQDVRLSPRPTFNDDGGALAYMTTSGEVRVHHTLKYTSTEEDDVIGLGFIPRTSNATWLVKGPDGFHVMADGYCSKPFQDAQGPVVTEAGVMYCVQDGGTFCSLSLTRP